jgi:hypothetical protein
MASPAQKYRFSGLSDFTAEHIEQLDEMLEDLYGYLSQSPLGTGDTALDISELVDTGVLYADANQDIASLSAATGNALLSGGVGAIPSFGKIALTTHVSGVLPVANGGTNNSSAYTAGSIIFSNGTLLTQDNAQLFWDDSNDRLGLGSITPGYKLDVRAATTLSQLHIGDSSADKGGFLTSFNTFDSFVLGTAAFNASNWIAKTTTAALVACDTSNIILYTNTGLSAASSFTPTERARFNASGLTLATPLTVANGGTGVVTNTAYAVLCGGTTGTGAQQSIAGLGSSGQVLTSNGAGALPTFQAAAGGGGSSTEQTTTSTGTQNDFSLSATNTLLRCNNASDLTITGFTVGGSAPAAGARVTIVSVGAGHVFFKPQNASSTAANRLINFASVGDTPLAAGVGSCIYEYDDTTDRWRLVSHDMGAWIKPTFDAAEFTASSGTWTVESADVTYLGWYLVGRMYYFAARIEATSVSTSISELRVALQKGHTIPAANSVDYLGFASDAGAGLTPCRVRISSSTAYLRFEQMSGSWNSSTNTSSFYGTIFFSVS